MTEKFLMYELGKVGFKIKGVFRSFVEESGNKEKW